MLSESRTILDLFTDSCQQHAKRVAYSSHGTTLTYGQLEEKTRHFAAYLQNTLKVTKGERMAIMLPNLLQYPVVMFGAFRAGLTIVNVNPLCKPRELLHQLQDTGATLIVILNIFTATLSEVLAETQLKHVIVNEVGDLFPFPKSWIANFKMKRLKKTSSDSQLPNAIPLKRLLQEGRSLSYQPIALEPEDIAYLQATGGTTGLPKSAILLHKNVVANVKEIREWAEGYFDQNEIMLTPLPLYHIFSLCINCLVVLSLGAHSVLIANPKDIKGFVKIIKKIPFTSMTAVNTLFNALLNEPAFCELNFSSLKTAVAGGMMLQRSVAEKWKEVTGIYICQGYGLTEASPVVTAESMPTTSFTGAIGFALPLTELKILKEDEQVAERGEVGELCVKGPQIMPGYWQQPDETAKVFTREGWLRTGDMAKIDEQGRVYIVDRKKNMISVSGLKVYPNEVEEVIAGLEGVLEVAVIGVPDPHSYEAVKAFIVRKDLSLSPEKILAFCRENMMPYKVPKHIEFRESLPKTVVGKILHRELKESS